MSSNKIIKYRPSLTASNINHILYLAKQDLKNSPNVDSKSNSENLIKTLIPFQAKIQNNVASPAYISNKKESMLEQLGEVDINNSKDSKSYESYKVECYNKYIKAIADDTGSLWNELQLSEIDAAKEFMYFNDLMSKEEEKEYEIKLNKIIADKHN